MAEYTFFTNPMSRGQIARWALHEVDADYDHVLVDWNDKPAAFLEAVWDLRHADASRRDRSSACTCASVAPSRG